jgi:Hemerythrin HHE cation binding domain
MTITANQSSVARLSDGTEYEFELVAFDLYRDIHKGIRAELFDITSTAGRIDPADQLDRIALAAHVASLKQMLTLHAHHEDSVIDPVLDVHMPDLAQQVEDDHLVLEARFGMIDELAAATAEAGAADQRRLAHLLYLELTGFTSAYLAHQLVEERVVMPALEHAVGVDAVVGLHMQIVGGIAPDVMARSLSFMLPAMNIDDRTDMLGGMRMSAPPEAFDAVTGLTRSVLSPSDFAGLAARLGLA